MSETVVYIEKNHLFREFKMTKEMNRTGEIAFMAFKHKVDSLTIAVNATINENEKQAKLMQLIEARENLEQFNARYTSENAQKIWTRIESYVSDFSKERDYKLVIGTDGKKDVMYGSEDLDVTADFIKYINLKYEGGK